MRKPGSQKGLVLRSTMEATADEWRSVLCLENTELTKHASQSFLIIPSCLPVCLSAHIHLSIHMCHSCPFPCHCPTCSIMLFMSCISASRSLSLLSAWIFSCLSSLSLCLSTLPHPNMSILLSKCPVVLYEVTLPVSVSSQSMSQLAWNHLNGFEMASK